ncbi:MAG: Mu transposase C-terminal domain-containing protein [Magnetococcales bacterium]|nr:Mu transposase C-terminal domain-containing protein [Magnetococcales bacterium]
MASPPTSWGTAAQLAGLPGLPTTARGVHERLKREGIRTRKGGGKSLEYHVPSLPRDALTAFQQRHEETLPALPEPDPGALMAQRKQAPVEMLDGWQRERMAARLVVLREVDFRAEGSSMKAAMVEFVEMARAGWLSVEVRRALSVALAKDQKKNGSLSVRTIQRWRRESKAGASALAPLSPRQVGTPVWYQPFMRFYRTRAQISVVEAMRQLGESGYHPLPGYSTVLRYLQRVGLVERSKGRLGRSELISMLPFFRRDTSMLKPMQVLNGDGYSAPVLVLHPNSGKGFRPELTEFFDVATRYHVGWSINYSENKYSVMDALRMAVDYGGVLAIAHYDNGSGVDNRALQDDVVGLKHRVGFDFYHQRPGSPRAGGVVEKGHQQVFLPACKTFDTYVGKQANDKDLLKEVKDRLKEGMIQLPTMGQLVAAIEERRGMYNNRPHRALPKIIDPITRKKRHQTPTEAWQGHVAEGWKPVVIDDSLQEFRLEETRTVRSAEIEFHKMRYQDAALVKYHGEKVRVRFDPKDGSKVWVWTLEEDRFICEARRNASLRPYLPESVLERGEQKRMIGQIRRKERQIEKIKAEARPTLELVPEPGLTVAQEIAAAEEINRLGLDQDPEAPPSPATRTIEGVSRPVFSGPMREADWASWALNHLDQLTAQEVSDLESQLEDPNLLMMLGLDEADIQKKMAG